MVVHFTDQNFLEQLHSAQTPVLVDFWASWCRPCQMMSPVIETLAKEYEGIMTIGKLNVEENPICTSKYNIQGIPALKIFKAGKEIGEIVGYHTKDQLVDELKKYLI